MIIRACLASALFFAPTFTAAQSITIETTPLEDEPQLIQPEPIEEITSEKGEAGSGAILRALDKVSGATLDLELASGQSGQLFGLDVGVIECRYPAGNPAGDAFAYLVIRESEEQEGVAFTGWMVASSPALSALDHARYDVWVLRCMTS